MPFFSTSANTNTLNMEFECFSAGICSGKLEGLDPVEVSSRNTATSLGMNWYKFFYIPKYMQLDLHLFFFFFKANLWFDPILAYRFLRLSTEK